LPQYQMPGSNKNFIPVEHYVNISDKQSEITLVSCDAPLIEVGKMANDPVYCGYADNLAPSSTIFSYVMNNYWETNYLAAQEGNISFHYTIKVTASSFDAAEAEKTALKQCIPLIVTPAGEFTKEKNLGIHITHPDLIVFALRVHQGALLLSLQNEADRPETLNIDDFPGTVFRADFWGNKYDGVKNDLTIPAKGIRHFLIYR